MCVFAYQAFWLTFKTANGFAILTFKTWRFTHHESDQITN